MRAIMTLGLCGIRPGQSVRFGAVFLLAETPMQGRGRGSAVHAGLAIAAAVGFAGTAWAQGAAAQGDARHGKAISYTCLGCHGIDGYKNAYPMYRDRKSTRLNSSHRYISYAVFCLKKKKRTASNYDLR